MNVGVPVLGAIVGRKRELAPENTQQVAGQASLTALLKHPAMSPLGSRGWVNSAHSSEISRPHDES